MSEDNDPLVCVKHVNNIKEKERLSVFPEPRWVFCSICVLPYIFEMSKKQSKAVF